MKRLHPELDAYTFRFEETLLEEIRTSYRDELAALLENPKNQHLLEGGRSHRVRIGKTGSYLALSFESYPLLWLSHNDAATYQIFHRFFQALDLKSKVSELIDYRHEVVMYCGFLVLGDRAPAAQWHCDYAPGANAFTLITPLFELDPDHGHLLYRLNGQSERYPYSPGEAIVFGEKTAHTTEPYPPSAKKRVLVSLTFGTDKLEYWPQLRESLDSQAQYFVLPCGHVHGTCDCLKTPILTRLSRWLTDRLSPTQEITS